MNGQYLFLIAIIPVIILLMYIYQKDSHKESFGSLFNIFMLGVCSIIPAAILERLAEDVFAQTLITNSDKAIGPGSLFIYVFFGIALIEEFVKWFVIKNFIYKTDKFDEYYDAIVYSTYASLGFACYENIKYVARYGFGTGIFRAITAVPGHACFGIIMGYFLCYTKFNEIRGNQEASSYSFYSLLLPVIAHTLYDYFLMAGQVILWIVFYICLLAYCIKTIRKVALQNQSFYQNPNINNPNGIPNINTIDGVPQPVIERVYCPNCKNQLFGGKFCPKCGYKL